MKDWGLGFTLDGMGGNEGMSTGNELDGLGKGRRALIGV